MSETSSLERQAALLRTRRGEIEALIAGSEAERAPVELDQSRVGRLSRMDAMQVQAMAKAANERRRVEIERIDAALARVADGVYGDCLACGEPIAAKRLELDPAATLCIECARH